MIVYRYIVADMDGTLTTRWMIAYIAKKQSKSGTVLPPVEEFVYYRTAIANGKLAIAVGNCLLAFRIVDDAIDDDSTCTVSSLSSSGSKVNEYNSSRKRDREDIK